MSGYHVYNHFAKYYDELTDDVPYERWADYFHTLFAQYQVSPQLVLDLACGTGNMTCALAKRGYDMIGIDASPDMLSIAREKDPEGKILFLAQGMTDFELYGTVGAIVCCLDSINYLDSEAALRRCFELAQLYLDPDGLFIFDINTPYKLAQILGDHTYVIENEHVYLVWQNEYDRQKHACTMDLDFFTYLSSSQERALQIEKIGTDDVEMPLFACSKDALAHKICRTNCPAVSNSAGYDPGHNQEQGAIEDEGAELYARFHETHTEYAYEIADLRQLLYQAGFIQVDVYDELSFAAPWPQSQRVFFVARAGGDKKAPRFGQ